MPASIEGVTVNLPTLAAATREAVKRAVSGRGFTLFTINLDHLVKLRTDPAFRAAYQRADLVSADGWPIVWLAGKQGVEVERTCGSDMIDPVCAGAVKARLGLYVVGPGPEAQAGALQALHRRHAGLKVAGAETPRVPADPAEIVALAPALAARINASGARLCFLCLGAPKQEVLAAALAPLCPKVGFLCVGAALDFIGGQVRRAPTWAQRLHMEWAWRMLSDPRRLAWRYVQCAVAFAGLALPVLVSRRPQPA